MEVMLVRTDTGEYLFLAETYMLGWLQSNYFDSEEDAEAAFLNGETVWHHTYDPHIDEDEALLN